MQYLYTDTIFLAKAKNKDMNTLILTGSFRRPESDLRWSMASGSSHSLQLNGGVAWQSNGGPYKGHPARALPFTLEVPVPKDQGKLIRIHLAGIFALWANEETDPSGSRGASIQLFNQDEFVHRLDLISGRHYGNTQEFPSGCRLNGDGTSLEMVDIIEIEGTRHRVDVLTIDVRDPVEATNLVFRDLGTQASFVLFDVLFEFGGKKQCPFKSRSKGVSLTELVSIIRLGDRIQFSKAIEQLDAGIRRTGEDLDEARGLALTFLAVISAALLELDAPRGIHRFQLEAARKLDVLNSVDEIANETHNLIHQITRHMIPDQSTTGHPIVDKAVNFVERYFARDISDEEVSNHLGLSTSHFRFLFKQTVGQPFHKYVIALRLERARQMLIKTDVPIHEVAYSVGFNTPVHFSRAFAKRFSMSPSAMRSSKVL